MPKQTGIAAMLDMLAAAGVRHVFGNPGTTELPLSDSLVSDTRFRYILGLQEVPVMGMADGYAMASGNVAVVNLHISCGLGHSMGMLYNAFREGTPLLVTAGQTDRRLKFEQPILASDMVRVAEPWTKWAAEIDRVEDIPSAVRRALQIATTPPTGPVFLSLPLDVQMEMADLDTTPAAPLDRRVRPPREAIAQAAKVLAEARNPAILVGSRVTEANAVEPLVRVAELLGAPAISEPGTTHGRLGFPCDHPLSVLGLPLWSPEVRERLAEYDVLLVVGMDLLRQYVYHEPARAIPEHLRLVHLDEDPWQIGKNYPVEVGVLGDIQSSLAELAELLAEAQNASQRGAAAERTASYAAAQATTREQLRREIAEERDLRPMSPKVLMGTLADILPENVAVIEEAVTTTNTMFERLGALRNTSGYFGHRGWALGWGLGCAMGVKLAWPERPVLAILGDGAAMYAIQGLWSAAHHQIPVTFVIANNTQYQILKVGARMLGLPGAASHRYVGMDLREPEIDIVGVARSLGVEAERIEDPDILAAAVSESLAGNRPRLFEVPIQRGTPDRLGYG